MFASPSNNVAGYVSTHVTLTNGKKAKKTKVGHAFMNTDDVPGITLGVPPRATPAEVAAIAQVFEKFADKVRELDAPR